MYAEPEDGYWPGWLLLALITFGCVWYFSSLLAATLTAIGLFVLGGGLLQMVNAAQQKAERKVPVKAVIVGVEGEILQEEWV